MANTPIVLGDATNQIKQVWAAELNAAIQFDVVVAALFDTRYEDQLKVGKQVNLAGRRNLTVANKAAGTDLTLETNATEPTQAFAITQTHWRAVSFAVEDIVEIQSQYDLRGEYTAAAGYALARDLDVTFAASSTAVTGLATVPSGTGPTTAVGTLGVELTDDNLISAWTQLANNACPITDRFMVVSPATYAGFLKIDKFVNSLYNGDDAGMAVHQAKVGNLYNCEVYVSQLLAVLGTANITSAMFHKSHFALIRQRTPTIHMEYKALQLAWTVVVDQIAGTFERLEQGEGAGVITNGTKWSVSLKAIG